MNQIQKFSAVFGLLGVFLFSGCGGSATAIQPMAAPGATPMGSASTNQKYVAGTLSAGKTEIPTHIINAVTGHLDAELRKRGLAPAAATDRKVRIDSTATYYRMRSGFSRMMVGMLAGKDGIECDVQLVDVASGGVIGTFKVSSYNLTAMGGEDDVARMLAAEIAKALQAYKP